VREGMNAVMMSSGESRPPRVTAILI
jgi:hypothetical protein